MRVLEGTRVLDLGTFITAPYAAMLLAELGADVIKIERPGQGDPFRLFTGGLYSPHFQAHNRHKRSITLDFTKPAGHTLLMELVKSADVLMINCRPGVEKKLGIAPQRLQALNPRLIYCAVTGFGADGPYSARPAYDNVGQALSGLLSRFHAGTDPRIAGPAISDAVTGIFACIGVLGALNERARTGVGRKVEVNMIEATVALAIEPLIYFLATGVEQPIFLRSALSQAYVLTCKDGRRIALQMSSADKFWGGFVRALERPDILVRYPDRKARVEGYDELSRELAEIFVTRTRDDWLERLGREDIPFVPERRINELQDDPQIRHLGVFHELQHAMMGAVKSVHRPIRYDGSNEMDYRASPTLGEHTGEVLAEVGVDAARLAVLKAEGIV